MNFKGIGWDGLQWIHLGLGCGQMAGSCVHGNEYSDSGKKKARNFMASGQPIEFLKSTALSAVTTYRLTYRGADKSFARPGRKQATATEDFDVDISYL